MIKVKDVFDFLNSKYPVDTAREFDNVGILVGDANSIVNRCVVALDCDINTVAAARECAAELIVTHHPVIFDGLKGVCSGSVVYELVKSGISVISMHTNLDVASGGVTEQLCEKIGLTNVAHYTAHDGFLIRSADCKITNADSLALHIKQALGGSVRYVKGKAEVKRVLVCSGSGGDFLDDVIQGGFDALVAGDIKHNVFIKAVNCGVAVFDAGHFNSENVIVEPLTKLLSEKFGGISFSPYNSISIKSV